MLNVIWGVMIIISVIIGIFTGNIDKVADAVLTGAGDGITLIISLTGIMCFWTGIMKIAEKGGVVKFIAKCIKPVTKILFPRLKQDSEAMNAIVMNMTANMFGMSNAATPLGLKAMNELDILNRGRRKASNEMCMFVLINSASIQLIPSTVIALRAGSGSVNPHEIIVPVWILSLCAIFFAVLSAKLFERKE